MIGQADITAAGERIAPHIRRTPLVQVEAGMLLSNHEIALKVESLQASGSFKFRGATNTILSNDIPSAGVVAISGGNHGAAVALAATRAGVNSTVFVPEGIAVSVKMERMRNFGAEVVSVPGHVDEAIKAYEVHAQSTGALPIHPYDAFATLAGQGTVAREIEDQTAEIDTLFVSVGGGGLIGGILSWYQDRVKVIAVETEGTNCLARSLAAGEKKIIQPSGISASGLGANSVGEMPWKIAQKWLGDYVVVSDDDTKEAQKILWDSTRILGEPGAATALAALTSKAYVPAPDERVGVLICGGNADPDWFVD